VKSLLPSLLPALFAYALALLLAALCAWLFGSTLAETYPDGILIYEPVGNAPPRPSAAFHIGMAMGWFFAGLLLAVSATALFSANRFKPGRLRYLPLPLALAALSCGALLLLALRLAG